MIKKFNDFNSYIYVIYEKWFTSDKIVFYVEGRSYLYYTLSKCIYYNPDYDNQFNKKDKIDINEFYKKEQALMMKIYSCFLAVEDNQEILPFKHFLDKHTNIKEEYPKYRKRDKFNL